MGVGGWVETFLCLLLLWDDFSVMIGMGKGLNEMHIGVYHTMGIIPCMGWERRRLEGGYFYFGIEFKIFSLNGINTLIFISCSAECLSLIDIHLDVIYRNWTASPQI